MVLPTTAATLYISPSELTHLITGSLHPSTHCSLFLPSARPRQPLFLLPSRPVFRFHIQVRPRSICLSLSGLSHFTLRPRGPPTQSRAAGFPPLSRLHIDARAVGCLIAVSSPRAKGRFHVFWAFITTPPPWPGPEQNSVGRPR